MNLPQRYIWFAALSTLAFLPTAGHGTTWHVPGDAPSIQAGVKAAAEGDTVLVTCGTYYEDSITLKSGIVLMSESGTADCVTIDAEGNAVVLICWGAGPKTKIEGITFTGGSSNTGGGIWCVDSEFTLSHCSFVDNSSEGYGGGIYCLNSHLTFLTCTFSANTGLLGGGLYCESSNPILIDCFFIANTAMLGGGVFCSDNSFAKVKTSHFSENYATGQGGAVSCDHNSSGTFLLTEFRDNATSANGVGGALFFLSCSPRVNRCSLSGNSALAGGAIFCQFSEARMSYCTFRDNSAIYGGSAVGIYESDPIITNCTLTGHPGNAASLVYLGEQAAGTFRNSLIVYGAGPSVTSEARTTTRFLFCDIFGNEGGDWVASIADQADNQGNLSCSPMFCDQSDSLLFLCSDSPCLPENNPHGVHLGTEVAGCGTCGFSFSPLNLDPTGTSGVGRGLNIIDWDQDGDLDIYIVRHGFPNNLLENIDGNSFTEVATGSLADEGAGNAATWVDFDNDGDLDLYLAKENESNLLLENLGYETFEILTITGLNDEGPATGVSWADFDNDGLLDLYIVNDGTANILFKNYGLMGSNWWFLPQSGVVNYDGPSSCAVWCDYDADGDLDIYLSNQFAQNRLFRNEASFGFWDVTGTSALADPGNGYGVAWGDYDNNGHMDLYFANDGQRDFLFRNSGGSLSLVSGAALGDGTQDRGITWGDLDNDSDLDLYISRHGQQDLVMRNEGDGAFIHLPVLSDIDAGDANSVACGDMDGDGDLDICVVQENQSAILLKNIIDNDNHWLEVKPVGILSNRMGIGARIRLVANGVSQVREITCGSGYQAQEPPRAHFGLGSAATVDSLVIRWPSGIVQVNLNLSVDRLLTVVEIEGSTSVSDELDSTTPLTLHSNYPNPCNPTTTISYELAQETIVRLTIYDLAGRVIKKLVTGDRQAGGRYDVTWDGHDDSGRSVATGIYVYRLEAGSCQQTRRLLLLR